MGVKELTFDDCSKDILWNLSFEFSIWVYISQGFLSAGDFYFAIVLPLGQTWDLRLTKFSTIKLVHKKVHIPPASKVFQAFQDLHLHSKHQ